MDSLRPHYKLIKKLLLAHIKLAKVQHQLSEIKIFIDGAIVIEPQDILLDLLGFPPNTEDFARDYLDTKLDDLQPEQVEGCIDFLYNEIEEVRKEFPHLFSVEN